MESDRSFIGKQIGNYHIVAEIAAGSFGSVYKAQHHILSERFVAVKVLHAYIGSTKEREQFIQEAQFLEKLRHRYILPLLDVGFSEGFPYLLTEYAALGSLRERLNGLFPRLLPPEPALTIITQLGQALHHAHQQNIIHRDLKPENILFNAENDALLADFGIATVLSTASVKHLTTIGGTPPYMAPEQFQGTISKESDQYALGCISYELFTGPKPFTAPDFISMAFKHATEQPALPTSINPNIPSYIELAILKAMAKQRAERYRDIPSFIMALSAPVQETNAPAVYATPFLQSIKAETLLIRKSKEDLISEGTTFYEQGQYEKALVAYEQALLLDPNDAEAYNGLGNVFDGLERFDEALAAYDHALKLKPNDSDLYYNKGCTLHILDRCEEALEVYEYALRLNPDDAMSYNGKGNALYGLKRFHNALLAYERALSIDPNYAVAYNNKGDALRELGRSREAQQAYTRAKQPGYRDSG